MRIFIGILIALGIFAALALVQALLPSQTGSENSYQSCVGLCALLAENRTGYFTRCALFASSIHLQHRRFQPWWRYLPALPAEAAVKFGLYLARKQ
ncbi:MAG: hypothetical protein ACLTE2_06115 [Eubacteriales bacterium]